MSEQENSRKSSNTPVSSRPISDAPIHLDVPDWGAVHEIAVRLYREIVPEMQDDEITHRYVDSLKTLLPGRMVAVRLFTTYSGELTVVYATGRLRREDRDCLYLNRETISRYRIDLMNSGLLKTKIAEHYRPLFHTGTTGFTHPILEGERLIGALTIEYRSGVEMPAEDRVVTAHFAIQLANALQTARITKQTGSLRELPSRLVDNATAPIIVVGTLGQLRFANRAFLDLLTQTREDIYGEDWLNVIPETERPRLLPTFLSALRGESGSCAELYLPQNIGTSIRMSVYTSPIMTPDREIEGVIFFFREVSAENPVALRQLVHGVVHEINNPLTSISVYGEYLLKKTREAGAEPADVDKLQRIVVNSERIRNFTRDLVAYARPPTEKPTLSSICDIINQALGFCEHLIEETGARVETRFVEGLPSATCVKSQLVQVFINLITNACQAMPPDVGLLIIDVSLHGENKLCVRVIDSGAGIPEGNLERVFEPFFTTKGQGKGTGLGLSIVKNIIEQHRGTISVTSEVGAGSSFEIILPCRPESTSESVSGF
jgi:two-component system, NtrC family, sensor kinase